MDPVHIQHSLSRVDETHCEKSATRKMLEQISQYRWGLHPPLFPGHTAAAQASAVKLGPSIAKRTLASIGVEIRVVCRFESSEDSVMQK